MWHVRGIMTDLFDGHYVGASRPLGLPGDCVSTATYGGADNCYRYTLRRVWDETLPSVMWLMMNPSVATEYGDDRTVAKCQRYARAWGYGSVLIGNSFAYRCTDQMRLAEVSDPVGPRNDTELLSMASEADKVIAAYGSPRIKALLARGPDVVRLFQSHNIPVYALKVGQNGRPCHPLYLSGDLLPFQLPDQL